MAIILLLILFLILILLFLLIFFLSARAVRHHVHDLPRRLLDSETLYPLATIDRFPPFLIQIGRKMSPAAQETGHAVAQPPAPGHGLARITSEKRAVSGKLLGP